MKSTINGKQTRITEDMRCSAEKKLKKLERYFGEDANAIVTYYHTKLKECVEITISYNGTIYRSEVQADTYRNALDRAQSRIEGQIRKNKTRLEKRLRAGAFSIPEPEMDEIEEEPPFEIRTKVFDIKPMTVEEAILQMNVSGHTFFVFMNAETGEPNVVYVRHEDRYGLIEPSKAK